MDQVVHSRSTQFDRCMVKSFPPSPRVALKSMSSIMCWLWDKGHKSAPETTRCINWLYSIETKLLTVLILYSLCKKEPSETILVCSQVNITRLCCAACVKQSPCCSHAVQQRLPVWWWLQQCSAASLTALLSKQHISFLPCTLSTQPVSVLRLLHAELPAAVHTPETAPLCSAWMPELPTVAAIGQCANNACWWNCSMHGRVGLVSDSDYQLDMMPKIVVV